MPVDRPTFSESWYRVADLKPRLRSTVQVYRRHFRGQPTFVIEDPTSNQFFKCNAPAYSFVGMLDGHRTVGEIWRICNDELGDWAPTQREVIQLLGQLYVGNLIHAEMPPDAEGLFQRYRKRRMREVQGFLTNLLFVKIPLIDPDRFLERWVGVVGWLYSWIGLILWVGVLSVGFYAVAGRWGDLFNRANAVLDPDNLPLLYLAAIIAKVFHEFSHGFACKRFGKIGGTGGEVHVMGVMFLVFMPLPYVDASSAWAFRSKWHRTVVGMAGMMVELAIAAIAAVVWANTGQGQAINAVAYNIMFLASVTVVLFNGNPLLRFDGYYILSDLIETPNLHQRCRQYLYYLVKRYVYGVRPANLRSPATTGGEKVWFIVFVFASTVYRVFITIRILLFVADKLFFVGAILAASALVAWLGVPLYKFVRYLFTNGELMRVRGRAMATTAAFVALLVIGVGLIPAPDRFRIEGVVEPVRLAIMHTAADGFVIDMLPSGSMVEPDGEPLLRAENPELIAKHSQLIARRGGLIIQRRLALSENIAKAQVYAEQLVALETQIRRAEGELADLNLHAPFAGKWISPDAERAKGAYLRRGEKVGLLVDLSELLIRATAGQQSAAMLVNEAASRVDLRVQGRPDMEFGGTIEQILPAGQEQLPSAALGYAAGGALAVAPDDPRGLRTMERFFEIRIRPDADSHVRLLPGQRVVARLALPRRPLIAQWWRRLLQVIQRRFHI